MSHDATVRTPLKAPFRNKEMALRLGTRYRTGSGLPRQGRHRCRSRSEGGYLQQRFIVQHPKWQPSALAALGRICPWRAR